jgi:Protein of unknown function (DUF632)
MELQIRERLKIKHNKKLSSLECMEHRGSNDSTVVRTRASINKLQSLLMAAREAVSTTASAIIQARDNELAPQLLQLFQG